MHWRDIEQIFQDKIDSRVAFWNIHKCINYNIVVINAPNGTTSLSYVVNPSWYQPLSIYWSHREIFWCLYGGVLSQDILSIQYNLSRSIFLGDISYFGPLPLFHYMIQKRGWLSWIIYTCHCELEFGFSLY